MKESMKKEILKAQQGNEKAMNDIINNNTGLIWNIIKRFKGRGYDTEDLYQIGMIRINKMYKKI